MYTTSTRVTVMGQMSGRVVGYGVMTRPQYGEDMMPITGPVYLVELDKGYWGNSSSFANGATDGPYFSIVVAHPDNVEKE